MTTISIMGTTPDGQVEVRDVEALFLEGCIAAHLNVAVADHLILTHVPTGRAIVAFSLDVESEQVRRCAKEFDTLLKNEALLPSWENAPLLSRRNPLVKAAWEIAFDYDCWFLNQEAK